VCVARASFPPPHRRAPRVAQHVRCGAPTDDYVSYSRGFTGRQYRPAGLSHNPVRRRDLLCVDIEGCHYPLVLSLRLMLQECLTPLLGAGAGTLTAVAISLQPHNLACPASQTSPKLKNISRAPDAPIDRSLRYDRRFVAYSITEYSNALCRLFHRFRVRLRCFCVCEMLPTTAWRHQYGAEKPDSA